MSYSVYLLKNVVNGKIYVGYTKGTPEWRFYLHVKAAKRPECKKYHLAAAIRKYGAESFTVSTIDVADSKEEATRLETIHILARQSHNGKIGYNMTTGGEGGITDEVRAKLSIANKGKIRTAEMRQRMSEARRGVKRQPHSENTKAKMSMILKGRFLGKENSTWKDLPIEELISLYESGLSVRDIAKGYDATSHTILARLKAAGVERRVRWSKCVENLDKTRIHGETCPWSKLTEVEVRQIRDLCFYRVMSQYQIAREYGVSQGTIGLIHKRKNWKEI